MILCKYWEDIGRRDSGKCTAGLFGGTPSTGVCNNCPHKTMGAGDIVALVAEPIRKAFKIPKCPTCASRREKLNKLFSKKTK